jgi:hypothetical protein
MATPSDDDVTKEVDREISAIATSYSADQIQGTWTLSDPMTLHLDSIDLLALGNHLNTWLEEQGATKFIDVSTEIKGSMQVGQVIDLVESKFS